VGGAERLWRWCRRNPVVAALTGTVAALLVVVTVVSVVAAVYLSAARTEADHQADVAKNQAEEAKQAREGESKQRRQAQDRLARLYTSNGTRALEQGDLLGSLPWLVEALKIEQDNPEREELQRSRLRAILQQCPRVQALHHEGLTSALFSPDGRRVLTASTRQVGDERREGEMRIWDADTGQPVTPAIKYAFEAHPIFSPDGCRVLDFADGTTGWGKMRPEGEVHVWDARTGQPALPPIKPGGQVYRASFSPDARRILTISGRPEKETKDIGERGWNGNMNRPLYAVKAETRVWDAGTGQPLTPSMPHDTYIYCASFSPDGRRIVTVSGSTEVPGVVRVWDSSTGRLVAGPLRCAGQDLYAAVFSPDGQRVLATGTGGALVWDAGTGQLLTGPLVHPGQSGWYTSASAAKFSPDGRRILTQGSSETRVWDAATGKLLVQRPGYYPGAWFSPDGRLVLTADRVGIRGSGMRESGAPNGDVRVWDAATGQHVTSRIEHSLPLDDALFGPDGRLILTVSGNSSVPGEARVWNAALLGQPVTPPLKHGDDVLSACFSADGRRVLTASKDGIARVWDLAAPIDSPAESVASGNPVSFRAVRPERKPGPGSRVLLDYQMVAPHFSPDGRHVIGIESAEVQVWDTITGRPVTPPMPAGRNVGSLAGSRFFSPDGRRLLTISAKEPWTPQQTVEVRVWDAATGAPVSPPIIKVWLYESSFSPDGRLLLFWDGSGVQVCDATTGQPVTPPLKHDEFVHSASFSPDGRRVVTAGRDKKVRIWDVATGQLLTPTPWHDGSMEFAAYSPDGSRLLTVANADNWGGFRLRLWDAATGLPVTPPLTQDGRLLHALFSPDGRRFLTLTRQGYLGQARVWDAATALPVTPPFKCESTPVCHYACFSRDSRRVLTITDAVTAQVWDATTGEAITPPLIPGGFLRSVAFGPDDRHVLTLNDDGRVRVWDASADKRPLPDLVLLAKLVSSRRIDESGTSVPFRAEKEEWQALQQKCPELFTAPVRRGTGWHQAEAEASEAAQDWFAATFHLDRLIAEQPGNADLYRRRGQASVRQDRFDKAVADLVRAIELGADDLRTWSSLALIGVRVLLRPDLEFQILHREAEALINGKAADPKK
jgi:WD40 repeat protein